MREMAAGGVKVQCIVTSPPYWALRDYGMSEQIGLEETIGEWVKEIVGAMDLAKELLADDGTLWLNLGDSYSSGGRGGNSSAVTSGLQGSQATQLASKVKRSTRRPDGLKDKELIGQPWRIAFALQAAGWHLRSDIIWHKPNPMPESVKDRPTKAHEYIFLLSKSANYHYDAAAIAEPVTGNAHKRGNGVNPKCAGRADGPGSHSAKDHSRKRQGLKDSTKFGRGAGWRSRQNQSFSAAVSKLVDTRNARTVWTIPTEACAEAHFATFPQDLARRCILAGSRAGDTVLDPFMGSGTVAQASTDLGRKFIGCELNPEYVAMHDARRTTTGMAV